MATVTFDGIVKKFGEVVAVNDLNLEINDGEFMVLVGPSGCGKTTSLRMIAGLEEISEGTLSIGDRVVNHVAPKDRDIAMVFQSYALYPHMTVYDNMAFGLKLRKPPPVEREQRLRTVAEIVGLSELLRRKPAQLPGGRRHAGAGPGRRRRGQEGLQQMQGLPFAGRGQEQGRPDAVQGHGSRSRHY